MENSLIKERRKGAGKKRVFAALFSFFLVGLIFVSAAIPAAAAPDETDAYLQQYLFGTKNFYHMRAFSDRKSTNSVTIVSSYSEVTNRTDVDLIYSGSSLGGTYPGYYIAKCGTCIDGEEMCYIYPNLYGANIGVVSLWIEFDPNENPGAVLFDPDTVSFYFSNSYGHNHFEYCGKKQIGSRLFFVYANWVMASDGNNEKMPYHNIAAEFYSDFSMNSFSVYTGLQYFDVPYRDINDLGDYLAGNLYAGGSLLPDVPGAHLTDAEEAYLLGLYNGEAWDVYNAGFDSGYGVGFNDGYDEGYDAGNGKGYGDGYSDGSSHGFYKGYNEGYDLGYDQGFSAADPDRTFSDLKNNINSSIDNMSNMLNEKVDGANTAIGDDDGNAVFAFFNGTWNGIADFYDVVTSGVSVSGIELSSFIVSLVMILMAFVLLKILIL